MAQSVGYYITACSKVKANSMVGQKKENTHGGNVKVGVV